MTPHLLWSIQSVDGPVPWEAHGVRTSTPADLREQAQTADELGFYGVLVPTNRNEAVVTTAGLVPVTRTLRFLTAVHPGVVSPAKLVEMVRTLDEASAGRIVLNAVNGNAGALGKYGIHLEGAQRYAYSVEYWEAFRALYEGSDQGYRGEFFDLARWDGPLAGEPAPVELWGAGASEPAVDHAARVLDRYLTFGDTPDGLAGRFARVGAAAEGLDRRVRFGARFQLIVRDTDEEAWAHAQWLLDQTSLDTALRLASRQLDRGLDEASTQDPQVERRLKALRNGELPQAHDLEVHPGVWSGPSQYGFDVLRPATSTWLVGSPDRVAALVREFESRGAGALILSGWPIAEEARNFAEKVMPLLNSP